jgi:hypothetical protein
MMTETLFLRMMRGKIDDEDDKKIDEELKSVIATKIIMTVNRLF